MFSSLRAAAVAAALFTGMTGASFAVPSFASEGDTPVFTAHYNDHATAQMDEATIPSDAVAGVRTLSHDIDFSTPVASHAVATMADAATEAPTGGSLASLVSAHADVALAGSEHECLAGAVYFESKGEPLEGQLAVAEVVINRAGSGKFPSTICGVVKQPRQFSFVRGGQIPSAKRGSAAWQKAVAVAHIAMNDLAEGRVSDAMFFHARRVSPGWRGLTRVGTVGNHIFYR